MAEGNNPDEKRYYRIAPALHEGAFQAKERRRKQLATLGFAEKLKILRKMRERDKAIAASGLRSGKGRR